MKDTQDIQLASLLAIVTNPEMVEKNIIRLQAQKGELNELIKKHDETLKTANKKLEEEKELETKNRLWDEELDKREAALKELEAHWFTKDAQQKENDKVFHAEKLQHQEALRQHSADAEKLKDAWKELEDKKEEINKLYAKAEEHECSADALRREFEDKLAHIKSFANTVGQ